MLTEDRKIILDDLPFQAADSVEMIIVSSSGHQPRNHHPIAEQSYSF